MSALDRLFGRDTQFYDLLEAGAGAAHASAVELCELIPKVDSQASTEVLGGLGQCRRTHKRLGFETTEALCKTFVTPLEREDIEALSSALYKISKCVEKIGERLIIRPLGVSPTSVLRQAAMLEKATALVVLMVGQLRTKSHGEKIKDSYEQLQAIEGEADQVMNELLADLYQGSVDPRVVVFLKDLYELLEKGIDRCRDAGYIVFHVALKYS
ncbi:MAG TPA: DUF47 family protein [Chthoniobacteraceae bacterium]|jgi:hypothetical protein